MGKPHPVNENLSIDQVGGEELRWSREELAHRPIQAKGHRRPKHILAKAVQAGLHETLAL